MGAPLLFWHLDHSQAVTDFFVQHFGSDSGVAVGGFFRAPLKRSLLCIFMRCILVINRLFDVPYRHKEGDLRLLNYFMIAAAIVISVFCGRPLLALELSRVNIVGEKQFVINVDDVTRRFVGREISLDLLDELRAEIFGAYSKAGYFARVDYPPQDLMAGVLTARVTELTLGEVTVTAPPDLRFSTDRAKKYITSSISRTEPLNINALDAQAQALNGLNGVSAEQKIDFSAQSDHVDVEILMNETEFFEFTGRIDNLGGAVTGRQRGSLDAQFNSLFGLGERTVINGVKAKDLASASADLEMPVGFHGSRIVVGGDRTEFEIPLSNQPNIEGASQRRWLRFRTSEQNVLGFPVSFETGLESTHSTDQVEGSDAYSTDKSTNELYVSGTLSLVNAASNAAANLTARVSIGDLDLSRLQNVLSQDAATVQTNGRYAKFNLNMTAQMKTSESASFSVNASCQLTSKNLDSSEEIELSGPSAVRAYDVAALSVDQGCFAQSEYSYQHSEAVALFGFVDMGYGQTHRNTYDGWQESTERNSFSVFGAGLGARMNVRENYNVSLTYARRVGSCLGCADTQADGRIWAVLGATF